MRCAAVVIILGFLIAGCHKPDSIELGGECQAEIECKDPSDQCITVHAKARCTMVCTKENRCPDEFVCAKMDVKVEKDGSVTEKGQAGYCLARVDVPAHAATVY